MIEDVEEAVRQLEVSSSEAVIVFGSALRSGLGSFNDVDVMIISDIFRASNR